MQLLGASVGLLPKSIKPSSYQELVFIPEEQHTLDGVDK